MKKHKHEWTLYLRRPEVGHSFFFCKECGEEHPVPEGIIREVRKELKRFTRNGLKVLRTCFQPSLVSTGSSGKQKI